MQLVELRRKETGGGSERLDMRYLISEFNSHDVYGVRIVGHLLLFIVYMSVLTGCSSSNSDLHEYIQQVKARPAGRIAPMPEFKPYETFSYDDSKLRDPFNVFAGENEETKLGAATGLRPDINRNKEALEDYPLDTLHFVGHLERDGKRWAIVTSPDKLVYRVRVGNHLGTNYGEIVAISETQIDIKEIIQDGLGGWIEREAALSLTE